MANIIDKKHVTLDEALDSKTLKAISTKDLERILQTMLCDMSDNNSDVNIIIAELLKRGVSKEEINKQSKDKSVEKDKLKKAFDNLGLDKLPELLEKSQKGSHHSKHKYLKIENGKYIYNYDKMTPKEHREAAKFHRKEEDKYGKKGYGLSNIRATLSNKNEADKHEKLAEEKEEKEANSGEQPKDIRMLNKFASTPDYTEVNGIAERDEVVKDFFKDILPEENTIYSNVIGYEYDENGERIGILEEHYKDSGSVDYIYTMLY